MNYPSVQSDDIYVRVTKKRKQVLQTGGFLSLLYHRVYYIRLFQATSKIRLSLTHYFQGQELFSQLLLRSGTFFQLSSKIRHF